MFGQTGVTPGTLSFQSASPHPFGYSRLDVKWSNFSIPNDGNDYWLRVNILLNGGSTANGQCVEEAYTEGSLNSALGTPINFNATSSSIELVIDDLASLSLTNPMTLFSIYYVGSPSTYVQFGWSNDSNTNLVYDFINFVPYDCTLGFGPFDFFPARTISGSIYKAPFTQSNCSGSIDAAVTDVDVALGSNVQCAPAQESQSTTNQSNGDYSFTVNELFNYSVAPTKTNNIDCGVNTLDATMCQQHVNGFNVFQYPYQVVAGDMNLNRVVTGYDTYLLNKLINGTFTPSSAWRSWAFPPAAQYGTFPPVTSQGYYHPYFDEVLSFLNLGSNQANQDFVGIKRGDVDGSCSDCNANFHGGGSTDRSLANVGIRIKDQAVKRGAQVEIPLYFSGWEKDMGAVAFALSLPTEHFEILSVKDGVLPHLGEECFNWEAMSEGLLRFAWANMDGKDIPLSNDEALFTIVAQAKGDLPSLKGLVGIRPDVQDCSMTTSGLERTLLGLEMVEGETSHQGVTLFPNPAKDMVNISFDVPENGAVAFLEITSINGRRVAQRGYTFSGGRQHIDLSTQEFPAGLLSYQLLVDGERFSGKFLKQD